MSVPWGSKAHHFGHLSEEMTFKLRPDRRELAMKGQEASQAGRELVPGQGAALEGARRDRKAEGYSTAAGATALG